MKQIPLLAVAGTAVLAIGLLATSSPDRPARLITTIDEPSTTAVTVPAPAPTSTTLERPSTTTTTARVEPPGYGAPPPRHEPRPVTTTTEAHHDEQPDRLTIACDSGDDGAAVVCEWEGVLEDANRLVLMRERPGTRSEGIWSTDDADTTRHVDETAELGVTYVYRLSTYRDDRFLETSNPVRVRAGGGEPPSPSTTVPRREPSPQQWYIRMSCGLNDARVVVCEWAEPPVAVAEWHVVRRHANDNEIPIPTTHERRITDPTAEPGTTYTYVVNGYDADGRSVVLASATVTTSPAECCTSGGDRP